MKIAHLSDIHFFKNELNFKRIFSKSLLGTLNYYFHRKKAALDYNFFELAKTLKSFNTTHVIITGDFTTTSLDSEYELASLFVEHLKQEGLKVIAIPGNHDHYTSCAHQSRRFYQYIEAPEELKERGLCLFDLNEYFQCLCLDTTKSTPFWSSQGDFSVQLEQRLKHLLDTRNDSKHLIVVNHFPVFKGNRPQRHQMLRFEALRQILDQYPEIVLYLHGHTHRSEWSGSRPICINCGSLTLTPKGSFHLMDLSPNCLKVEAYSLVDKTWTLCKEARFSLSLAHKS